MKENVERKRVLFGREKNNWIWLWFFRDFWSFGWEYLEVGFGRERRIFSGLEERLILVRDRGILG